MNQRGFIQSIYLYGIAAVLMLGMGYGLYYQIQKNGILKAERATLVGAVEMMNKQIKSERAAQSTATALKEKAEREAQRTHQQLAKLRSQHAETLSIFIHDGLVIGLFDAIAATNSDVPPGQPDGPDKTAVPKITLGDLYQWMTETVPETVKKCNADKEALRQLCQK